MRNDCHGGENENGHGSDLHNVLNGNGSDSHDGLNGNGHGSDFCDRLENENGHEKDHSA